MGKCLEATALRDARRTLATAVAVIRITCESTDDQDELGTGSSEKGKVVNEERADGTQRSDDIIVNFIRALALALELSVEQLEIPLFPLLQTSIASELSTERKEGSQIGFICDWLASELDDVGAVVILCNGKAVAATSNEIETIQKVCSLNGEREVLSVVLEDSKGKTQHSLIFGPQRC